MTNVRLVIRDVGTYGGIGRYIAELVQGMRHAANVDAEIVVVGAAISLWAQSATHVAARRIPLGRSLALLQLPRDGRVSHYPLHETTPFFALHNGPVVMTVHSVEALYMSRADIGPDVGRTSFAAIRRVRRRLSRVITPSAFERDRIVEHLRIRENRVDVIPHGVRHQIFTPGDPVAAMSAVRARFGLDRPFLLYVGHHQPQKNVVRLIEAFESLGADDLLLAIGGDTAACRSAYHAVGGPRVRYLGRIASDKELVQLYRAALGFCFPSLHESFGLPALEAMASGCPVSAARGTGLEQTVGDAALLFDPRDTQEIATRLTGLLDDGRRSRLVAAGLERARSFTWERSISAHIDTYSKAAA